MNAPVQTTDSKSNRSARDLNAALETCFALDVAHPPFPQRLTQLVAALTGSPAVSAWEVEADEDPLKRAHTGAAPKPDAMATALAESTPEEGLDRPLVQYSKQGLLARLPFERGKDGFLLVAHPPGGSAALSLAYERVSLICHIARAQFSHPDKLAQARLISAMQGLAERKENAMQTLADELAAQAGADYAAIGFWDGRDISSLALSGQPNFLPRAEEPARLRTLLRDIAKQSLNSSSKMHARHPAKGLDLILYLQEPTRRENLLPLAGALYGQFPPAAKYRRFSSAAVTRPLVAALILVGIGFIPVPDTARVPAVVTSENHRIITAPTATIITSVFVEEGDAVSEGDVLIQLNTRESELEIIRLQSERAAAVIEQESARLVGNAAALRNAELTVQRLDAQIELVQFRADSAVITSPIDGIAILGDLRQRVGTTVRQGDALLEVSDPRTLKLDLTILERDLGTISVDQTGTFRPDFNPSLAQDARVTSVSPAIDFNISPPTATADASFIEPPTDLRPGASGVLHIGDETRPIWRVLYSNLRDWLLLRVWI